MILINANRISIISVHNLVLQTTTMYSMYVPDMFDSLFDYYYVTNR